MPADQDFLTRLDAAIGCQQCGGPLTESVSDYFCRQECSEAFASARAPSGRSYDYFSDVDDYGRGWSAEDLADLEPVGWIRPPVWRLPRSTGDLGADKLAVDHALELATTQAQRSACRLRLESLRERRWAVWAKNWRLPRSTSNFRADDLACSEAERTATTDAQRAACKLRRESLTERRKTMRKPEFPGFRAMRGLDRFVFGGSPLVHTPIVVRSHVSWNPERSAVEMSHERPVVDSEFNARGTFEVRGHWQPSAPEMLRYELRRDSDDTLLYVHAVPDDHRFTFSLPHLDMSGCTWRVFNSRNEVIREFPAVSSTLYATSDPAPAVSEGDTVSISTSDGTRRYTVLRIAADGSMTCRRVTDDEPIRGAEVTAGQTSTRPPRRPARCRRAATATPALHPVLAVSEATSQERVDEPQSEPRITCRRRRRTVSSGLPSGTRRRPSGRLRPGVVAAGIGDAVDHLAELQGPVRRDHRDDGRGQLMTPQEHLHRARLAMDEGERQTMLGDSGSLAPAMHYGRAQAHALIGILELLDERLPGPPAPP